MAWHRENYLSAGKRQVENAKFEILVEKGKMKHRKSQKAACHLSFKKKSVDS